MTTFTTEIVDRYIGADEPDSAAKFSTYSLTTDDAASSYGVPVLVGPDGTAYGPFDTLPNGELAANALFVADWDLNNDPAAAVAAANKFRGV